ncbi:helix-turn-helix domain-containing protein [Nocardia nova]|uniref:helix-turn-helix domain-containing protein n=1 Tax=Nocardia nova TaxID=37330 RepID=UPI001FE75875|nr:helix-turn-helix domain-containing protein [Nocardia nova]
MEAITRRSSAPMRQVLRARIVLAGPAGQSNAGIARALAITADTARKWRKRFCGNGIDGLIDLPRSGRPRTFTAEQVAEVKAARALDLYARIWDDEPLGADDYVLSADEKPGVQARHRLRRRLGPAARRPMRVESEHQRGGTLAYFAAYACTAPTSSAAAGRPPVSNRSAGLPRRS